MSKPTIGWDLGRGDYTARWFAREGKYVAKIEPGYQYATFRGMLIRANGSTVPQWQDEQGVWQDLKPLPTDK